MIKKDNGITIVSLVVTIIVLLILAGITILALTGDNGILSSVLEAKNETANASKNIIEEERDFTNDINQDGIVDDEFKSIITVLYNNNGGEGGPQKQSEIVEVGQSANFIISKEVPARINYIFKGWALTADASTAQFQPGGIYQFAQSTTLYAVWISADSSVTVNPNGGIWRNNSGNSIINGKVEEIIELENPIPPQGYKITLDRQNATDLEIINSTKSFDSWTAEVSGKVDGSTYTFGEGSGVVTANYINNAISLPNVETVGFTFLGWYDSPSGGTKVGNANSEYIPSRDITLYAHWQRNSYTLTINPNGGSWNGKTDNSLVTQEFNTTITVGNPIPPTDYTVTLKPQNNTDDIVMNADRVFSGWIKDGPGVLNGTSYTFKAGNEMLTAEYTTKAIVLPAVQTAGWNFLGWFDSASGGSKVADAGEQYIPDGNTILYGHWERIQYTAIFNGNGGTNGESITKGYGLELGTLPVSTRTGYTFLGWYTSKDANSGTKISSTTKMPLNGATYYAHWDDKTVPTISISQSPTAWTKDSVTLTGTAQDSGSGVVAYQFSTSGSLTVNSSGWKTITATTNKVTRTYDVTSNGTYYFYVKDSEGNMNRTSITVSNIDKTKPTSSISAGAVSNKTVTLTAKGTDSQSGVKTYKFYVDGSLVSTQNSTASSVTYKYSTTFGESSAYVVVIDAVGNEQQSGSVTFWDYTIKTLAELKKFRDMVNGGNTFAGKTVTQIASINIGGSSSGNWNPIGNESARFNGTYDGGNYTISGLYSNDNKWNKGLFGATDTSAIIKNLTISGASIRTTAVDSGILVGVNRGDITSVKVSGGSLTVGASGGAIVGNNYSGIILYCTNSASISYTSTIDSTASSMHRGSQIGGIVGINTGGSVQKCINTGSVKGTHCAGGIAGRNEKQIAQCVNKGAISSVENLGKYPIIGGIAGFSGYSGASTISNSYNTGSVTSIDNAGGIVGDVNDGGGSATITNCYNRGTISGKRKVGGIVAYKNDNGTLSLKNNYWLSGCGASYGLGHNQDTSAGSNTGATSKTSAQLKALASTLGSAYKSDSENINGGYPVLAWQ